MMSGIEHKEPTPREWAIARKTVSDLRQNPRACMTEEMLHIVRVTLIEALISNRETP